MLILEESDCIGPSGQQYSLMNCVQYAVQCIVWYLACLLLVLVVILVQVVQLKLPFKENLDLS